MAFREPMGFAPASVNPARRAVRSAVQRGTSKKRNKAGRRRNAVVGGVGRASPASNKETKMAKRRRTAAQKAATKRMVAANRARKGTGKAAKKPAKRKPAKRAKAKKVSVSKAGTRRVAVKRNKPDVRYSTGAKTFVAGVRKRIAKSPRKSVTYTKYKSGKVGIVFRENPAGRAKAMIAGAAGFTLGLVGADVLDRYVATMATTSGGAALTGSSAVAVIDKKASGKRLMVQAGGAAALAVGAYLLRKKSMVGTYLLGGAAVGFAAKGLQLLVTDYIMPKVLPAATKERLGYIDGPQRPLGLGGPQRPFVDSRHVGPKATGGVGSCGCTRVPVNPAAYAKSGRGNCNPWPEGMDSQSNSSSLPDVNDDGAVIPVIPEPSTPGMDVFPGIGPQPSQPGGRRVVPSTPVGTGVNPMAPFSVGPAVTRTAPNRFGIRTSGRPIK